MNVNQKIKSLRENLGLNQPQFAKLLGVSKQTVSAWEKDGTSVPYKKQKLIAEKLNVPIFMIFDDDVIEGMNAKNDDELIESIKASYYKLSPEKRLEVLKLIIGK